VSPTQVLNASGTDADDPKAQTIKTTQIVVAVAVVALHTQGFFR
jgi:hypothetical protein